MTTTDGNEPIVLTRIFSHKIEDVFDAFSTGESLEKWLAPADEIEAKTLFHQFKVGGDYKIVFTLADGQKLTLSGKFLEIKQPVRIVFSWQWEEPDIHAGINSIVTVDLEKQEEKTQLTITHQKLSTAQAVTRHSQGWAGTVARLHNWLNRTYS